jgi:hypothetical protein
MRHARFHFYVIEPLGAVACGVVQANAVSEAVFTFRREIAVFDIVEPGGAAWPRCRRPRYVKCQKDGQRKYAANGKTAKVERALVLVTTVQSRNFNSYSGR